MSNNTLKIGIVGSGNVAHHLARAFSSKSTINLFGIYSRNTQTASKLANLTHTKYYGSIADFSSDVDLIIICASDDAIETVANSLKKQQQIVVHTSGVVSMHVLKKATPHYGSFYPLQTFTKERHVNLKDVPFLIDASDDETKQVLVDLAQLLSSHVVEVTDDKRRRLHAAAVMVNNFTNHLYALAKDYTTHLDLDFNLLKPLIQETALKALEQNPKDIQTGPARRNDKQTIAQHLDMIEDENLNDLYKWFTQSIKHYYQKD